jgi:hypothetical protein
MRPIFSWAVLQSGSFNPQILRISCSRYPIPTQSFQRLTFLLTKGLKQIFEIPPNLFLEKDNLSDLREVATCLSELLWMMEWCHCPMCAPSLKLHVNTVGCGWWWCIIVSFISISSHSIQEWPVTFSLCLADLTLWSCHIFLGYLEDLVLSARQDWSLRALDDVSRERSFDTVDTHLLFLGARVDNCSKRHSFGVAPLFKILLF